MNRNKTYAIGALSSIITFVVLGSRSTFDLLYFVAVLITAITVGYYVIAAINTYNTFYKKHLTEAFTKKFTYPPTNHKPAVVGYITKNKKHSNKQLSATFLDLVNRGYILVDDSKVFSHPNHSLEEFLKGCEWEEKKRNDPGIEYDIKVPYQRYETYEDLNDEFNIVFLRNKEKTQEGLLKHEVFVLDMFFNQIGDGDKIQYKRVVQLTHSLSFATDYFHLTRDFRTILKEDCEDFKMEEDPKESTSFINRQITVPGITLLILVVLNIITKSSIIAPVIYLILVCIVILVILYGLSRKTYDAQSFLDAWEIYKRYIKKLDYNDDGKGRLEVYNNSMPYAAALGVFHYSQIGNKDYLNSIDPNEYKDIPFSEYRKITAYNEFWYKKVKNFHEDIYMLCQVERSNRRY